MEDSPRGIATIAPTVVPILSMEADSEHAVWPPPRRGRKRKTAAPQPGDDAQGELDMAGNPGEEEEELAEDEREVPDGDEEAEEAEMQQFAGDLFAEALEAFDERSAVETGEASSPAEGPGVVAQPGGGGEEGGAGPQEAIAEPAGPAELAGPIAAAQPASPPEPGEGAIRAYSGRGRADVVCHLPEGGRLCYYTSKEAFTAECGNPDHGRCVLTRTSRGRLKSGRMVGGRPLGYMCAWLLNNHQPEKAGHWPRGGLIFDREERQAARGLLEGFPGGQALCERERPQVQGEPDEPE